LVGVARTVLFVLLFAILGLPWLERGWTQLPLEDTTEDAWLIVWVLDWVRYALVTDPRTLFDPPINYPAPQQLAGSEHFLASQILFVPAYWLTGSPVAAANLTANLSYGLAAAAMDALLRALGVGPGAAFIAALAYGFGWNAVPGRLHVLQSQDLFLPLTALALHRLRDRPTGWRALGVGVAYAAGLLSSYHMAVYLTAATLAWGCFELLRSRPGRGRYVAWAGVAGAAAITLLVVVSSPYLARPEAQGDVDLGFSRWRTGHLTAGSVDSIPRVVTPSTLASTVVGCMLGAGQRPLCIPVEDVVERFRVDWTFGMGPVAVILPPLVLAGLAVAFRDRRVRRLCAVAAALLLLRFVLGGSEYLQVGDAEVPMRALLAASPARFIRVPRRALALAAFGGALLVAVGADAILRRLGAARLLAVPLLAILVVLRVPPQSAAATPPATRSAVAAFVERWGRLAPSAYFENPALGPAATSYFLTAQLVRRHGGGPLLDLPVGRDGTTVVGQMLTRQPSISFYSGYVPAHVSIVNRLIARLGEPEALDDLVDMTRLRWIVIRDASHWPTPAARERFVRELSRHPRTEQTSTVGRFTVIRLDPTSRRPGWFESLSQGPRRGRSALGTALVPLPTTPDHVALQLQAPARVPAGQLLAAEVSSCNRGTHAWGAAIPERPGTPLSVQLDVRFIGPDASTDASVQAYQLHRDVPAGECLRQTLLLPAPDRPGTYRIALAARQVDGSDLTTSENPIFADLEVVGHASLSEAFGR
jgi:hypothetical protein